MKNTREFIQTREIQMTQTNIRETKISNQVATEIFNKTITKIGISNSREITMEILQVIIKTNKQTFKMKISNLLRFQNKNNRNFSRKETICNSIKLMDLTIILETKFMIREK